MQEQPAVGQRWISDSEPDLGLGTIIDVRDRQTTIVFLATGETRRYANESAPLTRVAFDTGDRVKSHEGWQLEVEHVEREAGRLHYHGRRLDSHVMAVLDESDLDGQMQFRTPRDRLFAGLLDGHRWFELRRRVFRQRDALAHTPVRGLLGARIEPLAHQIYIAVDLGERLRQRALLADEVGLGKTIEAGLVLHSQLVRGRVSRALVLVPDPLLHQWLVEMRRRFNLAFSLFDGERFAAQLESAPEGNPFLAEQLVLASTDELAADDAMRERAVDAGWDILIVDEAHHLEWNEAEVSPAYRLVERLAATIPSVLLLTATPEQLGEASHFARLRLLDPERFTSLDAFREEAAHYGQIALVAGRLLDGESLEPGDLALLDTLFGDELGETERALLEEPAALAASDFGDDLVERLVDRHGTGRLMYRNTRDHVPGFPGRELHVHRLDVTDAPWSERLADWLTAFLNELAGEKVLLIAAHRETVETLGEHLRQRGVAHAGFHEGLALVERDRAAAWFAEPDSPCRVLLCSEIGSEGRNFQFVNRLVTVELPTAPDLLEQRIGRLDRIGQRQRVEVHVPVDDDGRDERLMRWYRDGLDAFSRIPRTGSAVRREIGERLAHALGEPDDDVLATLIDETATLRERLDAELAAGRDRLLDFNSNRPARIQEHLDALTRIDRSFRLQDFLEAVFDRFGVEVEQDTTHWIIRPHDNMTLGQFPGLPEDGLSIVFSRDVALAREDLVFMTWDHPMVTAAMDLILAEGFGEADSQVVDVDGLPHGLTLLEALYVIECPVERALEIDRYLPTELQARYVGLDGRDYTGVFASIDVGSHRRRHDRNALKQVIRGNRAEIDRMIERAAARVERELPDAVDAARDQLDRDHQRRRSRLVALAAVNPAVDEADVAALDERHARQRVALDAARVRPVALRVLFNQSGSKS